MEGKRTSSRREDGADSRDLRGRARPPHPHQRARHRRRQRLRDPARQPGFGRHRVDGRHEASRRLLREEPDVHVDEQRVHRDRDPDGPEQLLQCRRFDLLVDRALCRSADRRQLPGPRACLVHGHGAPGAAGGQKALGVKVNVTKTPQTYLLGVMGQSTWTVNSTATSITGQPTGAPGGPAAADRHGRSDDHE